MLSIWCPPTAAPRRKAMVRRWIICFHSKFFSLEEWGLGGAAISLKNLTTCRPHAVPGTTNVASFGKGSIKFAQHINASQLCMPPTLCKCSLPPRCPETPPPVEHLWWAECTTGIQLQHMLAPIAKSLLLILARPTRKERETQTFQKYCQSTYCNKYFSGSKECWATTYAHFQTCTVQHATTSTAPPAQQNFPWRIWNGHFPALIRKFHKSCPSSTSATSVQVWGAKLANMAG